ncbi:MAG: type II toxin-antitoxin system VapC family toxin [Panacagrimonas sp.]
MRLLLDTHIAIWAVAQSDRLPPRARELIERNPHGVHVSAASIWEIAIKNSLGRAAGPLPFSASTAIAFFREAGFQFLDIRPEHAAAVEQLPPLHADPFDRLLLAQARLEPMHLMTSDERIAAYGDGVLRV